MPDDEVFRHILALIIVGAATVWLHFLMKGKGPAGDRGLWTLIIGKDKRVSTSKLQIVLWTYVIAFAVVSILANEAIDEFRKEDFNAEYLILLGSPAAAALLAKTFVLNKLANGTLAKPPAKTDPDFFKGFAQVITEDDGSADLFDFQYFLFTIAAITYFLWEFLPAPEKGLPNLPDALVALTGVSAASYITKKGLEREAPVLSGIYPSVGRAGDPVEIRGRNLLVKNADGGWNTETKVLFGGRVAPFRAGSTDESLKVTVPELDTENPVVEVHRSDQVRAAQTLAFRRAP